MTDALAPLLKILGIEPVEQIQEDAAVRSRWQRRRQLLAELRAAETNGTFSDEDLARAASLVEDIFQIVEIVLGDPDRMGQTSYATYIANCRLIAMAVLFGLGKRRIPREPTRAMLAIGAEKFKSFQYGQEDEEAAIARIWRFMYDEAAKETKE